MIVADSTGLTPAPVDVLGGLLRRVVDTRARVGERYPLFADLETGVWATTRRGLPAGEFWVGLLWLSAALTGGKTDRAAACHWMHRLAEHVGRDRAARGNGGWYGAGAGLRLFNDSAAAGVALRLARSLAESIDTRLIPQPQGAARKRAGDEARSTVEGLAGTVPLLAWATSRSRDPDLAKAAHAHVVRHIDLCLRRDGSVRSQPVVGASAAMAEEPPRRWARGQAWGMLAFAQAARWLSPDYLDAACRAADWWVANAVPDLAAPADFADPDGPWDTAASALAAVALLKLAPLVPAAARGYQELAKAHIATLLEFHVVPMHRDGGFRAGARLVDGYVEYPGATGGHEHIVGTYFLVEALAILTGALKADML